LSLWFDADDRDTINGGEVGGNKIVRFWKDKIGDVNGAPFEAKAPDVLGAGPVYRLPTWDTNGRGSIYFGYYTSTTSNSASFKRLAVGNCFPLTGPEMTIFAAFIPGEAGTGLRNNPGKSSNTAEQRMSVLSVWDVSRVGSNPVQGQFPDRQLYVSTYATYNATPALAKYPNTLMGYLDAESPWTLATSNVSDESYQNLKKREISTFSDPEFAYGKMNIMSISLKNNIKKLSIRRDQYHYNNQYISRESSGTISRIYRGYLQDAASTFDPVLVIGAGWPGYDYGFTTARDFGDNQPFQGYFCELLVYGRVLTETERNDVENYLQKKWMPPTLLPPAA
jgi:hypothetical protein